MVSSPITALAAPPAIGNSVESTPEITSAPAVLRPNTHLVSPVSGTPNFGTFPAIVYRRVSLFVGGPIILKYGAHFGKNRGYGLVHIWKEHFASLSEQQALVEIPAFVASIIKRRAPIHYEHGRRAAIFYLKGSVAHVEERQDGGSTIYSVVTAFPNGKKHGPAVGAVP